MSARFAWLASAGLTALACQPGAAFAEDDLSDGPRTIIVTAPGGGIEIEEAESLDSADIGRTGSPDVLAALTRNIAGVSLQDAQGNPWQPNLVYRGFTASPLQGQAQGLAVYLDGARFNQPFGDTVGFDLIPDAAIRSVSLLDASPAYGLNALGGTMVMETKTGAGDPGLEASLAGGSYSERDASIAAGMAKGDFSAFAAGQWRKEDGWRDHSPSELFNAYADLGFDGETAGVHAKFVGADTDLTGNGVAPVELLAARRRSVFTWPDNSTSRYGRISLHPWVGLGDSTRLEGTFYRQRLKARTVNGDAADIETCEDDEAFLCLETVDEDDGGEEEQSLLTDADGNAIADMLGGEDYGVLNRGRLHTRSMGGMLQLVDEREIWGGTNRLALGVSYDGSTSRFATSAELGALTDDRSVDGLGPIIVQADGAIAPVSLTAKTEYIGVFLADSLPITSRLTAEIGLRWNWAGIELIDRIGTALNGDHSFRRLNPGLELEYEAGDKMSLRAGYAETNRAPTPAELSCADENAPCSLANFFIADPPLRQVVAKSWELGASGEGTAAGWDIDWDVSGFRTTNIDDIQFIASRVRGRAYFLNVGSTRRQGLELKLSATHGGWQVRAGYAFTDATFRTPLTLSSPQNPAAADNGTIAVMAGDRLPGIPRHSATLTVDYEGMIGTRRFALGGDIVARSGLVLVGDEGNDNALTPGYALLNLRGKVEIMRGLSLFTELRNVFDRDYATFGTFSEVDEVELEEAPGAANPRAYGPGSPRRLTIGVRLEL